MADKRRACLQSFGGPPIHRRSCAQVLLGFATVENHSSLQRQWSRSIGPQLEVLEFFPKTYQQTTVVSEDGFVLQKRPETGSYVERYGVKLDNRWVVPYSLALLKTFRAHINVERCNKTHLIKYLFKYTTKGPERRLRLLRLIFLGTIHTRTLLVKTGDQDSEVREYIDCRYLSSHEVVCRMFEFDIHYRTPAVERLAWFSANSTFPHARALTYIEFPTKWGSKKIGRTIYINPSCGELYYLRMLLNVVKGATCYEDLQTVAGHLLPTFKDACQALGLLGDDNEWREALREASLWASATQLCQLFVMIMLFCFFYTYFTDDILNKIRRMLWLPSYKVPEHHLKNHVLVEFDNLFSKNGASMTDHGLPKPDMNLCSKVKNRLLTEELAYDPGELILMNENLVKRLNLEQKHIYDVVIQSSYEGSGQCFFVYGYGGTRKTFLWNAIISRLRSEKLIVLVVASSGVTSLLLPGGRTAHSRFKIPIVIDESSVCDIRRGSFLADIIVQCSLIIWDESPMTHRHCFESLDRSMRDILGKVDSSCFDKVFGGKTVLLGRDFRQVLPVVEGGGRSKTLDASMTNSYLWKHVTILRLTINMRLLAMADSGVSTEQVKEFNDWVLSIGDGTAKGVLPQDILISRSESAIDDIIRCTCPNLEESYYDPNYLGERAIVAPKNDTIDEINSRVLSLIPGHEKEHGNLDLLYPVEFLNSLQFKGIPPHKLVLKIGSPVMLLRNLNQSVGLCNGTCLIVTQLGDRVLEAQIIYGSHIGDKVLLPRIALHVSSTRWPFVLSRRQYPVRLCYAMTINKRQGQTLQNVGLYLPRPVFSHGQQYVVVSRVTSRNGLRILVDDDMDPYHSATLNIVYREVLQSLWLVYPI
ncbi:hypothetical protein BS78_10G140900 [Paspalum vaginatum]|nr:hypothetical protein BS78_10G140900 [Paspalum vaginatum]